MKDEFLKRIEPWRRKAQDHLADNLDSNLERVQEVGRYILLSGGKRLRPIMFLLTLELCGRSTDDLARYSSIFEFLHCASLLHDDVIDEAETRRKRITANRRWDNPTAILVGDHLFAKALKLAAEAEKPALITVLSDCIARLAEGQVLELTHQHDLETSYRTYLEIIIAKTAVLLAASTRVGAILAGVEPRQEEALRGFGLDLGVAFQMIDDLLDWAGEEAVVGKPVGQDIREGKATLPWIRALAGAAGRDREELLARAGRPGLDDRDWAWLKARVEELGGIDSSQAEAMGYRDRAKERLLIFEPSPARELLLELADYVCRRRF